MCSYNRLGSRDNNRFACGDAQVLTGILRNELGFKGFVTSDWGAVHGLPFINAGLDMEMPGSGLGGLIAPFWTSEAMRTAIANGTVSLGRLNEAVARILYQEERFGLLSGQSKHDVTPEPVAADERVVQCTAEQAATLLKNDGGALPLSRDDLASLALIGPGAGQTMAVGGLGERSGGLAAYQQIGTYDVLRERYNDDPDVHLTYAVADDMTGTPVPASALSHDGQPGLLRTPTTGGTQVDAQLNFTQSNGNALAAGDGAMWTGSLTVPAAGSYWLNIQSLGAAAQLTVDGNALGNTGPGLPGLGPRYGTVKPTDAGVLPTTDSLSNARTQVQLTAGAHTIAVKASADVSGDPVQVRLNWVTPEQQQANRAEAVAAAKHARTAIVFAWNRGDLSRPLPDDQDALIADIAAANPNTIVVLNNDLPLALPWLDSVRAVLDMWFPGDAGADATANVLTGRVNPGGRLPFTWPKTLDQGLANQPGQHPERTSFGVKANGDFCTAADSPGGPRPGNPECQTTYSEGIFIGYRWYDLQGLEPLFPFGYGCRTRASPTPTCARHARVTAGWASRFAWPTRPATAATRSHRSTSARPPTRPPARSSPSARWPATRASPCRPTAAGG